MAERIKGGISPQVGYAASVISSGLSQTVLSFKNPDNLVDSVEYDSIVAYHEFEIRIFRNVRRKNP